MSVCIRLSVSDFAADGVIGDKERLGDGTRLSDNMLRERDGEGLSVSVGENVGRFVKLAVLSGVPTML